MMAEIARARAVLAAFNAYTQAVDDFRMVCGKVEFIGSDENSFTIAEADIHASHNIRKMLDDDKKMGLLRDYRAGFAEET